MDFTLLADHIVKLKENEKKNKYLDLARGLKKLYNSKVTITSIIIGVLGTANKGLMQGLGNIRVSGDHPNYYIIEIGQNTEKSPEDLRRLKAHQLTLMGKLLGIYMIITLTTSPNR